MKVIEEPHQVRTDLPDTEALAAQALIREARQHQRRRRLTIVVVVLMAVVVCGVSYAVISGPSTRARHTRASSPTKTVPGGQSGSVIVYVLNSASGTVTPINTATNTAGTPIRVGKQQAQYIGISLDALTVYVGRSGALSAMAHVIPIQVATNRAGKPVNVPVDKVVDWGCATTVATTPNGKTDYLVVPPEGIVLPITVATGVAGKPIRVGRGAGQTVIVT